MASKMAVMRKLFVAALALVSVLAVAQTAGMKKLKALEKSYLSAKSALAKSPKDAKLKKKFITAGVKYGHECMTSQDLDRKLKYKYALRAYREVLKLDPDNEVAKPESELIISIYKQMGRPIPD